MVVRRIDVRRSLPSEAADVRADGLPRWRSHYLRLSPRGQMGRDAFLLAEKGTFTARPVYLPFRADLANHADSSFDQ